MNLEVTAGDLAAAGARLTALAARLGAVRAALAREVGATGPMLGAAAEHGLASAGRAADRALRVLGDDVEEMGRALRMLTAFYARVDDSAVSR